MSLKFDEPKIASEQSEAFDDRSNFVQHGRTNAVQDGHSNFVQDGRSNIVQDGRANAVPFDENFRNDSPNVEIFSPILFLPTRSENVGNENSAIGMQKTKRSESMFFAAPFIPRPRFDRGTALQAEDSNCDFGTLIAV